jgi:hypothetical protein
MKEHITFTRMEAEQLFRLANCTEDRAQDAQRVLLKLAAFLDDDDGDERWTDDATYEWKTTTRSDDTDEYVTPLEAEAFTKSTLRFLDREVAR